MKRKFMISMLIFSLFFISACAKKEAEQSAVSGLEIEGPIFFQKGNQSTDDTIPESYDIYPKSKKVEIVWGGFEEEDWEPEIYELLSFSESDSHVEFTYLNEEDEEIKKRFEFLSESIAKDENNQRYERF